MSNKLPNWSFAHEWSNGFTETLEWLTSVLQSQTGAEQRLSQRLAPRRFFEYTLILSADERAYFDMLMIAKGSSDWMIPVAHDAESLTDALPAGSTKIFMDTDAREFLTGSRALMRSADARFFEIIRIDQVIEDGMVLIVPTVNDWPAGSKLYPLIQGRLTEQPQMTRKTDGTWIGSAKFLSVDQNDWPIGSNLNILLNEEGLVVNAFQPSAGRGAYFDQASGTSEGQLILIMGLLDGYAATGDVRALVLAQRMLDATAKTTYDGVQPPAVVTQTATFAPHWLFVVKKPIKACVINYDDTFVFANGIAQLPDNRGPLRLVFQVLSLDYELLWKNPYSALLAGTVFPIASYAYDAVNEFTTVTLTTPYNGPLKVIYSSQNGNRLDVGSRYEAWPDWRPLAANETDCACDTLNWAFRAFAQAATVFPSNPYYAAAREATRQQTAIIYDVNDSRDWIKPSFTKNAFGDGSRFSVSTRGSPVRFECDDQGNVMMEISTGTGESQYGNASINDVYRAGDQTIVQIGSTRPCTLDLYIDPTQTYNYHTRYVKTLSLAGAGALQTFTLSRTDFVSVDGVPLPLNSPVYTFGVTDRTAKNHTVLIGRVRQTPNINIPYYPGAIPFTANFLGQPYAVLIDWRGPVYMGYQSPRMWAQIGNTLATANCCQLLSDSQDAYNARVGQSGPFAPVFYFDRSDAYEYGAVNTFGFVGPDPNTGWGGYQYRPLAEIAQLYFEDVGTETWHAQSKSVTMRFLTFLDAHWTAPGGPPTDYPTTGAAVNYDEPHFVALIVRAALFIDQRDRPSGVGTINSTIASIISKVMSFWTRTYVSDVNARMFGTFCTDVVNTGWFGFWHGEIMRTLRQLTDWWTTTGNTTNATITRGWLAGTVQWAWANSLPPPVIPMFQGYQVVNVPPDEAQDLSYDYTRLINTVDTSVSLPLDLDAAAKSFPTQAHNFTLYGRDEHATMRDLLYTLKGKLVPVWLPTFMSDITLVVSAFRGGQTLRVNYLGYADYGVGLFGRTAICIQLRNGDQLYHEIESARPLSDTVEELTLDAPLEEDATTAGVLRISFMSLCRLDTDTVDIKHLTNNQGVSQVGVTFKAMGDFRDGADWTPPGFPNYRQIG